MKRILFIIIMAVISLNINAQPKGKFNPEMYMKEQEAFIIKQANLTPQEATAFTPVFREMHNKQRELFNKMRGYVHRNPQTDKEAETCINAMSSINIQIMKLEQQYHARFCKVIPARKAYQCIKAQEMFKHQMMEKIAQRMNNGKRRPH